jgi:hypothetical protein
MVGPGQKKMSDEFPDAWSRFERAVDVVAKSPPQHRAKGKKSPKKKKSKSAGGVHKSKNSDRET